MNHLDNFMETFHQRIDEGEDRTALALEGFGICIIEWLRASKEVKAS